jgi:hypothetical protein
MRLLQPGERNDERESADGKEPAKTDCGIIAFALRTVASPNETVAAVTDAALVESAR